MGDENSKPVPPPSSKEQQQARENARNLHEEFSKHDISGRDAILGAYDNEDERAGIEAAVAEIESYDDPEKAASGPKSEKLRAAEKREAHVRRAAERKAKDAADDWFEQQLAEGAAAEKKALAAKAAAAAVAAQAAVAKENAQAVRPTRGPAGVSLVEMLRAGSSAGATVTLASPLPSQPGPAPAATFPAADADEVDEMTGDSRLACPLQEEPRAYLLESTLIALPVPSAPQEPAGDEGPPPALPHEPPPAPPPAPDPPPAEKTKAAAETPEFYKLLNVCMDATFEEIKKGYRKEALKWHPDKNRSNLEAATERFQKISEAFDTLFDPKKREAYDSGKIKNRRAKKLTGHGWADIADEDDAALTVAGWKWKRQSWRVYVFFRGRIDDEDPIVDDPINDPRVPAEKLKVFWRHLGEMAHVAREEGDANWLKEYVAHVWKDTPDRWPGAMELKGMNEAAQGEWKERRVVYNRRRQKVLLHIELHEAYLAIPNRVKKEKARLASLNSYKLDPAGNLVHVDRDGTDHKGGHALRI